MSEIETLRANFDRGAMAYVGTRQVLGTVARMAARMTLDEFRQFQKTVLGEVAALEFNGEHADIWKQAVEAVKLDGPEQYALLKIGLHPAEKAEIPEKEPAKWRRRGTYKRKVPKA